MWRSSASRAGSAAISAASRSTAAAAAARRVATKTVTASSSSRSLWLHQRRAMATSIFVEQDQLLQRHIGPSSSQLDEMAKVVGYSSADALMDANVPHDIRRDVAGNSTVPIAHFPPKGEAEYLADLKEVASKNRNDIRSFIGLGYYGTKIPTVILRNVLENPGWYTAYTPYQAEISQGRLESLLNWQTMVTDLTGMDVANASLLDEGTAAAEAMSMAFSHKRGKKKVFVIASDLVYPQTAAVVQGRAELIGVEVIHVKGDGSQWFADNAGGKAKEVCGFLTQYPAQDGSLANPEKAIKAAHDSGALAVVASDLLASTVLKPAGEFGADIVLGNSQRFGVPMGYGGPHAAFFAVKDELKRSMPGRLIGVSKDRHGNQALRMALQTREQHIRRETATSNICTAQALLANTAAFYAVYHGADGLTNIAKAVHSKARILAAGLDKVLHHGGKTHGSISSSAFFDTVKISGLDDVSAVMKALLRREINIRAFDQHTVTISLDETTTATDIQELWEGFAEAEGINFVDFTPAELETELGLSSASTDSAIPESLRRTSKFLTHPVFSSHRSETEILRYMKSLEEKDFSLVHGMIPLGSCTMKLNASSEMIPITWPEFANVHPFAPIDQAAGYAEVIRRLDKWLSDATGFDRMSLQPNAGSQGEYLGLVVIQAYHKANGNPHRNICLIPTSAHGTNPASAAMAGMKIVAVNTDHAGNVDMDHLKEMCQKHSANLSSIMITYPSTYGVFEPTIKEVCDIVHQHGGQVYMDGANMNSQVGYTSPGACGADVCHLNLHKTFCIPHGGGGPGMGPIGVAKHLTPFLPGHPLIDVNAFASVGLSEDGVPRPTGGQEKAVLPCTSAPFSSALILNIPLGYIQMMGSDGLKKATRAAVINANYMAARLKNHYDIRFTNDKGLVAHEFILDGKSFKGSGISVEDIAKRLMDYGFHAPTMSWPVHDTLMVEPTESEPKSELDRLCDALISIRKEISMVEAGEFDKEDNPLKNAPHTAAEVCGTSWNHTYSREVAAFPSEHARKRKFWPTVGRIDNVFGDRNLICTCPSVADMADE